MKYWQPSKISWNNILLAWLTSSCVLVSACTTAITGGTMAVLTVYDQSQKREQWMEYAKRGDVYAQYELAESYAGSGLEGGANGARALEWYCKAAVNGFAKAQIRMGALYEQREVLAGVTVPQDYAKAYMWYQLAVDRANADAWKYKKHLANNMSKQQYNQAQEHLKHWRTFPCEKLPE